MPPTDNSKIWKLATSILASSLATGIGAYLITGFGMVSKADLPAFVEQISPYGRDKQALYDRLSNLEKITIQNDALLRHVVGEKVAHDEQIKALQNQMIELKGITREIGQHVVEIQVLLQKHAETPK
jgi:uncharacterized protein HemX